MSDWLLQLIGPVVSGSIAGLVLVAGLNEQVKSLKETMRNVSSSAHRAHVRIDDHIRDHLQGERHD